MSSAQNCAQRLREQAYRTLLPQIRDLEQELHNVSNSLSTGVHQIERKLEALSHIELPATELVLSEILENAARERDLKAGALVVFAQSVRRRETQEEILSLLLETAQKYCARTALFAVRGDQYVGWSSRGFSDALARKISECSFARRQSPKFEEALETEAPVIVSEMGEADPLSFLGKRTQGPSYFIPLKVMDRPVAILMTEGIEGDQNGKDALSMLVEYAVLRLENIALKILYALTSSNPDDMQQAVPVREIPAPRVPEPEQEQSAAASAAASWAAVSAAVEPVPPSTPAFEAEQIAEPDHSGTSRFDLEAFKFTEEPAVAAEASPLISAEEAPIMQVAVEVEPPPAVSEPEPVKAQEFRPLPEEEKLHSDAKRFARLLVSEIKLYNERHVIEGRENHDLYIRLKRDIDRSREMYEKRISPIVSRKIDYFHDEIIRILGDNDPSTLGSDYPGPRVES